MRGTFQRQAFPAQSHSVGQEGDRKRMKRMICIAFVAAFFLLHGTPLRAFQFAVGADVSFLKQAEDQGKVFKDNGEAKPALQILKDHG